MAQIAKLIGMGPNRRRVLLAAGAVVLAVGGGLIAWHLGAFSQSEGKVTLKSRVLEYNRSLKFMKSHPTQEERDAAVTALMNEYFELGMPYDDVIKILSANDLSVDEKYENVRDFQVITPPTYFNRIVVSVIRLSTFNPLLSFEYRLVLEFKEDRLDVIKGAFAGTGP
jgi:hypothetical protein